MSMFSNHNHREKRRYVTCRECAEEMHGICDARIREVCEPCGGRSLIATYEKDADGVTIAVLREGAA